MDHQFLTNLVLVYHSVQRQLITLDENHSQEKTNQVGDQGGEALRVERPSRVGEEAGPDPRVGTSEHPASIEPWRDRADAGPSIVLHRWWLTGHGWRWQGVRYWWPSSKIAAPTRVCSKTRLHLNCGSREQREQSNRGGGTDGRCRKCWPSLLIGPSMFNLSGLIRDLHSNILV